MKFKFKKIKKRKKNVLPFLHFFREICLNYARPAGRGWKTMKMEDGGHGKRKTGWTKKKAYPTLEMIMKIKMKMMMLRLWRIQVARVIEDDWIEFLMETCSLSSYTAAAASVSASATFIFTSLSDSQIIIIFLPTFCIFIGKWKIILWRSGGDEVETREQNLKTQLNSIMRCIIKQ